MYKVVATSVHEQAAEFSTKNHGMMFHLLTVSIQTTDYG